MKKIFICLLSASILFTVSCKKDKDDDSSVLPPAEKVLSTTEAKSALQNSTTDLKSEMEAIGESDAVVALDNMDNVDAPFGNPMKSTVAVLKSQNLKSLKSIQSSGFAFADAQGVWYYNDALGEVEKKESSTSAIIHFPADSNNMTVNNAILTIEEYSEIMDVYIDPYSPMYNDTSYLPTRLKANLKVDNAEVMSIDFTASYTSEGDPKSLSLTASVETYTISATFADAATSQTISASFKNGSKTLMAASLALTYESADVRDEPKTANGYIQLADVKMQGNINILGLNNATDTSDMTATDFNTFVVISFYRADGAKIGDLKGFEETAIDEWGYTYTDVVPYIVYADGTKEKAETYMDDLEASVPTGIIPEEEPVTQPY